MIPLILKTDSADEAGSICEIYFDNLCNQNIVVGMSS